MSGPWSETRGPTRAILPTRKNLHGHAVSLAPVPVGARTGLARCLVEIGSVPCLSGHPAILIDGYECRHAKEPVCTSGLVGEGFQPRNSKTSVMLSSCARDREKMISMSLLQLRVGFFFLMHQIAEKTGKVWA